MRSDRSTLPATTPGAPTTSGAERYVLVEKIGEGAMGVVWSARDTLLDREVALKLLHDRFLGADHQALLAREARAMARLSHPNVVAVYDAGEQGGRAFVAMELVRGVPLSQWLTAPRSWQAVTGVFRAVADGLAAAHAAGILHRDIKPSNVLVGDDGRVRIADFGVAYASTTAALEPDTPLTAATTGLVGSPAYMSLERICGEPAEPAGDQFAFCVALHEALYGRRPFDAPTVGGMIVAIARGVPPRDDDVVPAWLHAVVARGLAANPAARFPSMTELAAALRGPPPVRRRTVLSAAAGTAVLATIAVAGWRLAGSGPGAQPDAAPVATAPIDAPLAAVDTAATAPVVDAASDPATGVDAGGVDASVDAGARPTPRTTRPPNPHGPTLADIAKMDPTEVLAKYRELMQLRKDAWAARDFKGALKYAEAAILYARGNSEPRVLAATASCALVDEKRARMHFGKLPKGDGNSRIAVVVSCRFRGIELDELLTPDERLHAR